MITAVSAKLFVEKASSAVVDELSDRIMGALLNNEAVRDADVAGSLAHGEISVNFYINVASAAEGASMGPRYLHDAVRQAGVRPTHPWTDIDGVPFKGQFEAESSLDDPDEVGTIIRDQPYMVREIRTELVDV